MDEKNFGYIISPALVRKNLTPGEAIEDSFTFTNAFYDDSASSHTFYVTVKFLYQEGNSNIIYDKVTPGKESYSMNEWITIDQQSFTLSKGQTRKIAYTIDVPENASPGGKYAAIVVSKNNPEQQGTGAKLSDNIAYQILGTVPGEIRRSADIIDFTVNKKIFWLWPFEKATFTLDFKNSGNVEYLPSGEVFLHKGDISKDIWTKEFNPNQLVVLPTNTRAYTLDWQATGGPIKTTENGVTLNLDYVRMGRFVATAKVGIEQNNQRIVTDHVTSFYIVPLPLIAGIILVYMLSLGIKKLRERKRK